MKPISFPMANRNLLKPDGMTDEQCGSLPVWTNEQVCVSLWKPTLRERLSILLFGRVWLTVHSGRTQPPVAMNGIKTMFKIETKKR